MYRQDKLKGTPPPQRIRQIKMIQAMQALAAARQHNAKDHPALPRQIDRRGRNMSSWPASSSFNSTTNSATA